MTELEFKTRLENEIDKNFGIDYGFIMGTTTPFIAQGFMSSSKIKGFTIWKKYGDEPKSIDITIDNEEDSIKQIINFLK